MHGLLRSSKSLVRFRTDAMPVRFGLEFVLESASEDLVSMST